MVTNLCSVLCILHKIKKSTDTSHSSIIFQCFVTVGWVTGRPPACKTVSYRQSPKEKANVEWSVEKQAD